MKTITRRKLLLASAAAAVMGMGLISGPAAAFDEVNWVWNKNVEELVTKEVNILIDANPTGMVELEKIQFMIGDVTATSSITNFTNNPPGEEPAPAPAPAPGPQVITIDLLAHYGDMYSFNGNGYDSTAEIFAVDLKEGTTEGVELGDGEGTVDKKRDEIWMAFDLTVPPAEAEPAPAPVPEQIPIGERLAVDLPTVVSNATAVGNNQDVESSTSIELHDGQFLIGDIAGDTSGELFNLFDTLAGNSHTDGLNGLVAAAATGDISSTVISADSSVSAILNATVDSQATAVGNNASFDLAAFTPDDANVIGDATQFAYADIIATSTVSDVTIEGYSDMGAAGLGPDGGLSEGPQIPAINSVATAVGNNFSMTVSSPDF